MFLFIKDIVPKCTEKIEGQMVYQSFAAGLAQSENVRLDFFGIMTVTDDFINGMLGAVEPQNFKQLHHVRAKNHILTKIKTFSKSRMAQIS